MSMYSVIYRTVYEIHV